MWHVKITKPSVLHDFRSTMSRACQQVELTEFWRQEGILPYIQSAKQHNAHLDLWIPSQVVLGESYYKMENHFRDRFFSDCLELLVKLDSLKWSHVLYNLPATCDLANYIINVGNMSRGKLENRIKIGSLHVYMSIHNLVIQRTVCAGDIL